MRTRSHNLVAVLFALFLISGATGLAYEIIWTRLLIRVFGATSFAVTTVLASYMAGLALGSYLFGRIIDRGGNPARMYGLLELAIGVFALLFPLVLRILNPLYRSIYPPLADRYYTLTAVRFVLCFCVLLIPTTLMGGTLPVLSKYVVRNLSHLTQRVGSLYAVNTIGAVAGAFGTGFFVLPHLGLNRTTWLCAVLNFIIFMIALAIGARSREVTRAAEAAPGNGDPRDAGAEGAYPSRDTTRRWDRLVLVLFMLTGFFALSIEVIWTRVLSLVVGTTVYAFSVMLTTFLLGLGVGSAVFARVAQRARHPGRILGFLVAAIGVTVFTSSIAFGKLPVIYMYHYENLKTGWGTWVWLTFLLCFIIMLVPAFLMGGVFPLVARLYARHVSRVGSEIGTAYAFNTIGSIFGSFAGSFIFLRYLGVERGLTTVSAGYFAVSAVLLLTVAAYRDLRARVATLVALVVIVSVAFTMSPGWDRKMMTSGVYRYAALYKTVEGLKDAARWRSILFYNEGPGATVSVERVQNEIALIIDGKGDASTSIPDMSTQLLLAHLPLLFHPDPDTVLIIGLGAGVTLGSAERYPVSKADCAELLESVVDAAVYFKPYTYDCLSDPRTRVIVGDGRNHILLTDQSYDVIISQPPNPWISGVGDLFTLEFFEMMKRRLKPDGIATVWLHVYQMGDQDLRSSAKSFISAFPHATLWMANESDVIFMGSSAPFAFDGRVAAKMAQPRVASDLKRIRIDEEADIFSLLIAGTEALRSFARPADRIHTDDNLMLEFSAAKRLLDATEYVNLSNFLRMLELPPMDDLGEDVARSVRTQMEARSLAITGRIIEGTGKLAEAVSYYSEAYAVSPSDEFVLSKYIEGNLSLGDGLMQQAQYDRAAEHYRMALVDPDYPRAWAAYRGLANYYIAKRDYDGAYENLQTSLEKNPYNPRGFHHLGQLQMLAGNTAAARSAFERAIELAPDYADALNALARIYLSEDTGKGQARSLAERAVSIEPRPDYLNTLGWAYDELGNRDRARAELGRARELDPDNPETLYRLAMVELETGHLDEYRRLLERLVSLGGKDEYSREARTLLRTSQTR